MVGILTTILKRKRLLPAKSLSSTWSNVPPMSGNTTHSQVPGNVGSAPSNLQGFACVKNDELKMHLAVLEAVCLGVLKVHIKRALRLAEHLPIHGTFAGDEQGLLAYSSHPGRQGFVRAGDSYTLGREVLFVLATAAHLLKLDRYRED